MNFVKSQLAKAEQLLEQVDATAEEMSVTGVSLSGEAVDTEALAATLKQTLEVKRRERELREQEFLSRIKILEMQNQ